MIEKKINNKINFFLILFTSIILLHKLRDFNLYNIILISIVIFAFLYVWISDKGIVSFNNSTGILFIIYILYLSLVLIMTAVNFNRFGMDINTFLNATGRLYLMPIFTFVLINLIINIREYDRVLLTYTFFIFFASLTLLYQHYFGKIEIWRGYDKLRYGTPGFASLTGNVVTYGPSIGLAILYLFFYSNINNILKIVFIFFIVIGIFLTMSKSALLNLILCTFFVLLFFKYVKIKFLIFILAFFISCFFILDKNFRQSVLNLTSQTSGVKVTEDAEIRKALYQPIDKLIYDRIFSKWFISGIEKKIYTKKDILIGQGLVGGAAALAAHLPYDKHPIYGTSTNTTHSTYIDFIQMGGILGLTVLLILMTNVYYKLAILAFKRNFLALILFFGNIIFFINCFVANGVIFQPYTSFVFWISIAYLINSSQTFAKK